MVRIGDRVRHLETGIVGTVDDVTGLMSEDDRELEGVAVRFLEDGSGRQIRALATELEVIEKGSTDD